MAKGKALAPLSKEAGERQRQKIAKLKKSQPKSIRAKKQ